MNNLEQRLNQLELLLKTHQHTGADFTQVLRNQDFQQLGKIELLAAATSMSITIPPRVFLRVLIQFGAKSGVSDDYLTFNSDSGSNYTFINSGGTARTSQAQIDIRDGLNSALGGFCVIDIANYLSSIVKPIVVHTTNRITSAATSQTFYQIFGNWVNTANQITTIKLASSNSQTYPVNSSLLVLGSKF